MRDSHLCDMCVVTFFIFCLQGFSSCANVIAAQSHDLDDPHGYAASRTFSAHMHHSDYIACSSSIFPPLSCLVEVSCDCEPAFSQHVWFQPGLQDESAMQACAVLMLFCVTYVSTYINTHVCTYVAQSSKSLQKPGTLKDTYLGWD